MYAYIYIWLTYTLFTPLRGRVRPHQGYKVSYVVVVVVVDDDDDDDVVVPGRIF